MESSKLSPDIRRNLYLNKYRYKTNIRISAITFCRLYQEKIKEAVPDKLVKIQTSLFRYGHFKHADISQLEKFMYWRIDHGSAFTLMFSWDLLSLFTNDLSAFETIGSFYDGEIHIKEAVIFPAETGVIYFKKEPQFPYRTYLKTGMISAQTIIDLRDFKERYNDQNLVKFSPNLKFYCEQNPKEWYFFSKYAIDHSDESMSTLLRLSFPKLIDRTYRLLKQPEI